MPARTACALFAVVAALMSGCVERRFRIESNPPGAYVLVNSLPYGPTPVDVPFIYYGHYDIVLMKDGYVTKRVRQEVRAPWYQIPPLDFFAESLWPHQITDIRPLIYDLEPLPPPNLVQLKAEAIELRQRATTLPPPRYPDIGKEDNLPAAPAPPKSGESPAPRPIPEMEVLPPRPIRPLFDPLPGRSAID